MTTQSRNGSIRQLCLVESFHVLTTQISKTFNFAEHIHLFVSVTRWQRINHVISMKLSCVPLVEWNSTH